MPYWVGMHSSAYYSELSQLPPGVVQVNLDQDVVFADPPALPLPVKAGEKLLQTLQEQAPCFAERPSDWRDSRLAFSDSAFNLSALPTMEDSSVVKIVDWVEVKDTFLRFQATVLARLVLESPSLLHPFPRLLHLPSPVQYLDERSLILYAFTVLSLIFYVPFLALPLHFLVYGTQVPPVPYLSRGRRGWGSLPH